MGERTPALYNAEHMSFPGIYQVCFAFSDASSKSVDFCFMKNATKTNNQKQHKQKTN